MAWLASFIFIRSSVLLRTKPIPPGGRTIFSSDKTQLLRLKSTVEFLQGLPTGGLNLRKFLKPETEVWLFVSNLIILGTSRLNSLLGISMSYGLLMARRTENIK